MALSSFNEEALQMLMKYELKVKRKHSINKKALAEELPLPKSNLLMALCECLTDCLRFSSDKPGRSSLHKEGETDRRMSKKAEKSAEEFESIQDVEIFWSEVEKVKGKRIPLFSTITHPFSIKQSKIIVSNLTVVFQELAQHPKLLKKLVSCTDDKFYVKLFDKDNECIIAVDNSFPFFS
jgi:hypothetical protein